MTIATAYRSVDMFNSPAWYGYVTAATTNHIQITYGGYVQNYYGSFAYNSLGVSEGVVSSTDYYEFGRKIYEISGGSFDALSVANYINNGDMQGVSSYVFSGADTYNGSPYSDSIHGYSNDDTLFGNGGDDFLRGGQGNDILNGGDGIDTAFYSSPQSSYSVIQVSDSFSISGGADGTDTLNSIEFVQFTDQTVAIDSLIDAQRPIITNYSPVDEAREVAIDSNFVVTFSEAIKRGAGYISIKTAAGATIASYDIEDTSILSISNNTLTINPAVELSYSTDYKIEFAAGVIQDLAGNNYAATSNYNFTTVPMPTQEGGDITNNVQFPAVPATNMDVYLSTELGSIYAWNMTSGSVTLVAQTGLSLTDIALDPDGRLFGITANALYRLDPETGKSAIIGQLNTLEGELYYGVSVLSDANGFDISPTGIGRISSGDNYIVVFVDLETGHVSNLSNPRSSLSAGDLWYLNDTDYLISTSSSIIQEIHPSTIVGLPDSGFREGKWTDWFIGSNAVDGLIVAPDDATLATPGTPVGFVGNNAYMLGYGGFAFGPGLATLSIDGNVTGATVLRASAGMDNEAPTIITFSPSDDAIGVLVGGNIVLTFSEAIVRGTGSIVLKNTDGTVVENYDAATSGNVSISDKTLTINPSSDLATGASYKVDFSASSVKDLAGNAFAGTSSYNFKTLGVIDQDDDLLYTMAQFSRAAYRLHDGEPRTNALLNPPHYRNDERDSASGEYDLLKSSWSYLSASDLPTLAYSDTVGDTWDFGLRDGIFTNQNSAALLARNNDTLIIAFRGTNDAAKLNGNGDLSEWGPLGGLFDATPDRNDWDNKSDHYANFLPMVAALESYISDQNITNVYVTGHSLGAAMVDRFVYEHPNTNGVDYQGVTFASPGYYQGFKDDLRIANFWIDGDAIKSASWAANNLGDLNNLHIGFDQAMDGEDIHSIDLYLDIHQFLNDNGIGNLELLPHGNAQDFDSICLYVSVVDMADGVFIPGLGANILEGTIGNDLLVGGVGNDAIDGSVGTDTAVYSGKTSDYSMSYNRALGTATVTDRRTNADGTDSLKNIEKLQFSDKTFDLINLPISGTPGYGKMESFLFDGAYYLLKNPELAPAVTLSSTYEHYKTIGAATGDAPNAWFDSVYYANKWADLKSLNLDAATLFMHYNLYGVWEGRSAGPMFDQYDGIRYLTDNPDVAAYVDAYVADFLGSRSNGAIAHYVIYGANEGRIAFDTNGHQIEQVILIGTPT